MEKQDDSENDEVENKNTEQTICNPQNEPCEELPTAEKLVDNEAKHEVLSGINTRDSADLEFVIPVDQALPAEADKQNEEARNTTEAEENVIDTTNDTNVENDQKDETILESEQNVLDDENAEIMTEQKETNNIENTEVETTPAPAPAEQVEDELGNVEVAKEVGTVDNSDVETPAKQEEEELGNNKVEREEDTVDIETVDKQEEGDSQAQPGILCEIPQVNTDIDHNITSIDTEPIGNDTTLKPTSATMETNKEVVDTSKDENVTMEVNPEESITTEIETEKSKEEIKVNPMESITADVETEESQVQIDDTAIQNNSIKKEKDVDEAEIQTVSGEQSTESVPIGIEASIAESSKTEDGAGINDVGQTASEKSSSQQENSSVEKYDDNIETDTKMGEVEASSSEQMGNVEENDVTEKKEEKKDADLEEQKLEGKNLEMNCIGNCWVRK